MLADGKILDGRNRYIACQNANVEPIFEQYAGEDPIGFVISKNVKRRHLTVSERAAAAARVVTIL